MKYSYIEAMTVDIKEYIKNEVTLSDCANRDELEEKLYNALFIKDSVTGYANKRHIFNTYQAEEYLCHNLGLLAKKQKTVF